MLKVLALESGVRKDPKKGGGGGGSILSANQNLEGHSGEVRVAAWNTVHQKLTTSDEKGLIIVWALNRNTWLEEMINNRILFCAANGRCDVYDSNGNFISRAPLPAASSCLRPCRTSSQGGEGQLQLRLRGFNWHGVWCLQQDSVHGGPNIVGVEWCPSRHGRFDCDNRMLAMAIDNGIVRVMAHESEEDVVQIDTELCISRVKWSPDGSTIAVAGSQDATVNGERKTVSLLRFYSPSGQRLRTIRVPGERIDDFSWEGGGLRLALAVGSFIYFAIVRPDYKWAYFSNTLVYAFGKKGSESSGNAMVTFWNSQSNERYTKHVKHLAYHINMPINHLVVTDSHVVAASEELIYAWHFKPGLSLAKSNMVKGSREKTFHVDDINTESVREASEDLISSVCADRNTLLVGRASGVVQRYSLPQLTSMGKHVLRCRPWRMALNCDATRLAIIDINGVLSLFDFTTTSSSNVDASISGDHLDFERKDVCDILWSEDSPDLFAISEKSRIYLFRGLDPEEPITCNACLCRFRDLELHGVNLDRVMLSPEDSPVEEFMAFEARSLRDMREILKSAKPEDAHTFVEENPHPRLWRILAEHFLCELNFEETEKAFVRCEDYHGIQFVDRLQRLRDSEIQKAEIDFYFQRFDEAERRYLSIDRSDLAIEMRFKLGDWFRVEELVAECGSGDATLVAAWNNIGEYYFDRHDWYKAAQYYSQAKNSEKLVKCLCALEDYEGLEKLLHVLPDGSPLLLEIREIFQAFNLCEQAVAASLKLGDPKRALDSCILTNQWRQAVEVAAKENFPQIEQLLSKYANRLIEGGRMVDAVELYMKANRHMEAAKILTDLAQQSSRNKAGPLVIKKLYVLAAVEVENFRKRALEQPEGLSALVAGSATAQPTSQQTLAGLMTMDAASMDKQGQAFDDAWHAAEAYHFWMLAHRQLQGGGAEAAMRTALHLRKYDDLIDPHDIYAFLALASFQCQFFGQCSKALVKLESMESIPAEKREQYSDFAMSVFTKHAPNDPRTLREAQGARKGRHDFLEGLHRSKEQVCVASGKLLRDHNTLRCKVCRHPMIAAEVKGRTCCPLCHAPLHFW
ncbi:unnamed protein product [Ostreobium quekettii]|uniref:Uncharacterized protein n=1 Tax=Ostreobium quekettii TaxID=121088 RepID=A0A8S1J293_9CHLO|nr:unnamed protein product [Ostreobium quekettii]